LGNKTSSERVPGNQKYSHRGKKKRGGGPDQKLNQFIHWGGDWEKREEDGVIGGLVPASRGVS